MSDLRHTDDALEAAIHARITETLGMIAAMRDDDCIPHGRITAAAKIATQGVMELLARTSDQPHGRFPMSDQQHLRRNTDTLPSVEGRCPGCGSTSSLFLADGGYVTCARADCEDPGAASDLLETPVKRTTKRAQERIWGPNDTYVVVDGRQVIGARPGQMFERWESQWRAPEQPLDPSGAEE